jgi:hypothetical protein
MEFKLEIKQKVSRITIFDGSFYIRIFGFCRQANESTLSYSVPEDAINWSQFFRNLEELKKHPNIENYWLAHSIMNKIFS